MKKVVVTLTAVGLAAVLNFGIASAHPFSAPTAPPAANEHQTGDQGANKANTTTGKVNSQSGQQDADVDEQGEKKTNATTGKQDEDGQMGEQDADVDEQGDNDANTTTGTQTKDGQTGMDQDGEHEDDK